MRLTIITLVVASLGLLAWTLPQERMKKEGPPDFKKAVHEATAAFEANKYGTCAKLMKKANVALWLARRKVIRASMPQIADCKTKDSLQFENAQGRAGVGAMLVGNLGAIIERTYDWGDGKTLKITVNVNEAMAKIFLNAMAFAGNDKAEVIKYNNGVKAALKVTRRGTEWTAVLGEAHITVRGRKVNDEEMLQHMNQKAVDSLSAAINN